MSYDPHDDEDLTADYDLIDDYDESEEDQRNPARVWRQRMYMFVAVILALAMLLGFLWPIVSHR